MKDTSSQPCISLERYQVITIKLNGSESEFQTTDNVQMPLRDSGTGRRNDGVPAKSSSSRSGNDDCRLLQSSMMRRIEEDDSCGKGTLPTVVRLHNTRTSTYCPRTQDYT